MPKQIWPLFAGRIDRTSSWGVGFVLLSWRLRPVLDATRLAHAYGAPSRPDPSRFLARKKLDVATEASDAATALVAALGERARGDRSGRVVPELDRYRAIASLPRD